MKLTVEYDAHAGHVCKDGEAQGWVDDIIHHALYKAEDRDDLVVTVASGLLIDYFRLRLAQGVIKVDQIEFTFNGEVLEHNEHARIKNWPRGFCDYNDKINENLLTISHKAWVKGKPIRDAKTAAMKAKLRAKIVTVVPCKECHKHPCTCPVLEDNELTGLQDINWKNN